MLGRFVLVVILTLIFVAGVELVKSLAAYHPPAPRHYRVTAQGRTWRAVNVETYLTGACTFTDEATGQYVEIRNTPVIVETLP